MTSGTRSCDQCGRKFKPTRYWQKYCSKNCRYENQNQRYRIMRDMFKGQGEDQKEGGENGDGSS